MTLTITHAIYKFKLIRWVGMAFSTPQRNVYTDSEQQNLSTSSSSLSESQIMCHIITVFYAFYNILKSLDLMRGISWQSNLSEHVLRALYELNAVFLCFDLYQWAVDIWILSWEEGHHLKTKELLQVISEFLRFISYFGSTGWRQITSAINEQSDQDQWFCIVLYIVFFNYGIINDIKQLVYFSLQLT